MKSKHLTTVYWYIDTTLWLYDSHIVDLLREPLIWHNLMIYLEEFIRKTALLVWVLKMYMIARSPYDILEIGCLALWYLADQATSN